MNEHSSTRRGFVQSILAAGALARLGAAGAQARASGKTIRVIAPFSAGGPTDAVARAICAAMASELEQPVVVENKAGANGVVASEYVANAPPDGQTLLYHTSAFTTGAALSVKLPYDPLKDFAFIGMTTSVPLVLLVNPDSPVRTPAEFVAAVRSAPEPLKYGSVLKSIVHVAPEQLLLAVGAKAVVVSYKGTAPAITDLIGKQIDFAFDAINSAVPFIRSGRLRPIAVASLRRSAVLPDVPTFDETVLPGFEAGTWGGDPRPFPNTRRNDLAAQSGIAVHVGQPSAPRSVRQARPSGRWREFYRLSIVRRHRN